MYIANNNNCWFTNVGEAFIDIGVKNIINKIRMRHDDIIYGTISPMSKYYIENLYSNHHSEVKSQSNVNNFFNPLEWMTPDLFILPGMFATEEFAKGYTMDMIRKVKRRGGRVAFLGFGGYKYDDNERYWVVKVLKEINPLFVITRDNKTYELYKNYIECSRGLDCAYWLDDGFNPCGLSCEKYIVSTFNRSDEPEMVSHLDNLIHPWHMQYSLTAEKTRYLSKSNLMISDSPYDYITLYANAEKVYTDLVHATIVSLVYGTPVKYYKIDNRRDAFESLSCLSYDNEGFMSINKAELNKEKRKIEQYIETMIYKNF